MNEPKNALRSIFNEAAELDDAGERAAFLQQACGDDAGLRRRVEELLHAHDHPAGFLDESSAAAQKTISIPLTEKPGDRIGRYKLLEQIGEGGCGTVYMAEQEEPVRRRVALKVIKLGMDTKSVIARFEAERQALALMDHPNIAKVHDAGATDTGRPYFVMELVRGIKITDYCDQNNLPTGQRLALFNQVCHAIQHAHQKGIIHRDIKPSNILVTLHDGVPVPKVIDFGIAKATTGQRLTDKTIFTAFEQFIGTPAYMSPEQAEMSGLDVDTRSDIYALGILLYELLTGTTPFDAKELMAAGLDAMRRTIREKEPARPSTRLSTMLAADRTTVAKHRQSDPAKLSSLIRGDLDWIVMKALEKDRTRRYETASGFATDIQRHLNHEPVTARPPTSLYRFQKLFRRNKLAFAAASAVLAALMIGLGVSTWLFIKEKDARERAVIAEKEAQAEARKSRQVAGFLQDMLESVGPSVALGRDTAMLREILDKTAERVNDLKDQPVVEAELRNTLGEVYMALGEYEKAESMIRKALALRRMLLGNEHRYVAISLNNLAMVLAKQAKLAEAETINREALAMRRNLFGNEHGDIAKSLNNLALVLGSQGKLAEAETMHREALAMWRNLFGHEHPVVANFLYSLAGVLHERGQRVEAETMHREVLAMRMKLLGSEHPDVAYSLNNLASVLWEQGKLVEAETMYREALTMGRKLFGNEHPNVAGALDNLAAVLADQNRLADAEAMHREALAMRRKRLGNEHPGVATSLNNLATVLDQQGKFAEAETMHREALAMRRKLFGNEHPEVATSLNNLGHVVSKQDKLTEAESFLREALAMKRKLLGGEHPDLANALNNLGRVLFLQGKLAEAETMHREGLAMTKRLGGNEPPNVGDPLSNLAAVLQSQGRLSEAEAMNREALAVRKKHWGNEHPAVAKSLHNLASVLADQDKLAEAETVCREAVALRRKVLGNDHPELGHTLQTLAVILHGQGKLAEAESMQREALAIQRKHPNSGQPDAANNLASLLLSQGKLDEAEILYREALAAQQKVSTSEDPALATSLSNLAVVFREQGKPVEAETMLREALRMRRKLSDELDVANSLNNLALVLRDQDKLPEAETTQREALSIMRRLPGNEHPTMAASLGNLATVLQHQGKFDEAEPLYREALAGARKSKTNNAPALEEPMLELAENLYRQRKYAEAEPLYREVIASLRARLAAEDERILNFTASLARLLAEWAWTERSSKSELANSGIAGRAREAETLLRDCLAIRERGKNLTHWRIADVKSRLGEALVSVAVTDPALDPAGRLAKLVEAEPLMLEGNDRLHQSKSAASKYKRDSLTRLVRLYETWEELIPGKDKAAQAAEWKKKLSEFDNAKAEKKPAATE